MKLVSTAGRRLNFNLYTASSQRLVTYTILQCNRLYQDQIFSVHATSCLILFPAILATQHEQAHLIVQFSSFVDYLKWNGLIEFYKQKYEKIPGLFRNHMNIINIKQQASTPVSALLKCSVVGFIISAFDTTTASDLQKYLSFSPDVFIYIFVPFIIFDATYFLNKTAFFHNFLDIVTFAIIGTLISTVVVGIFLIISKSHITTPFSSSEFLTYSALVSAVDPVAVIAIMESMHVNEDIFNICFGESTLNDGVAIVLFNLFKSIDSLEQNGSNLGEIFGLGLAKFTVSVLGAIILGTVVTFTFCLITRISHRISNLEPILFVVCALICYVLADALLFSGVISVMTSALVLLRYAEFNLNKQSVVSFQTVVHAIAQCFESILFVDMGLQIAFVSKKQRDLDTFFSIMVIPYTLIARMLGIWVQCFFLNMRRAKVGQKLTWRDQLVLIMCGLRGGIAFALANAWKLDPIKENQVRFATSLLVVFTIFVYGLGMKPLLTKLKIKLELKQETGYDYACKTLAKPVVFTNNFITQILGKKNRFEIFLAKLDSVLQHVFLKNRLPLDRELQDSVEQLQQIYIDAVKKQTFGESQERKQSLIKQQAQKEIEKNEPKESMQSILARALQKSYKMENDETEGLLNVANGEE
ncbi:Sodium/hydrogen_exchanger [Hexamita inflata]|uniref:Sodium/hydrogen exchanger 8 n=1 Tax=Hexamita inflata TaxID=28002 RepID=A0AA86R6I3_9EUKA|nr:Sodium/hydrogen exchanger [Hexamita inflata]